MLSAILKEANEEDAIKTKLNATLEVFECRGIRRRRICISSVNSTRPLEAATEVSDQPTAASYPATWSLNVDFEYGSGTKLLRISTFLVLDPGVMEGPNIISPGFIDSTSRGNGSGQGRALTLSS